MLTLNISKADIELANYERIHNPTETVRKRMDAIYWTSQGLGRKAVLSTSGMRRNPVRRYIKKDALGTHCYECAEKFHQAIETSLFEINHNHDRMADIKTLITPRFQTFAQSLLA